MNWFLSDIHGCYREYCELLEKINLSDDDTLWLLGDMVDRGPEPVKVVQDVMRRPNVVPFLGNHDFLALNSLYTVHKEMCGKNVKLSADERLTQWYWRKDGGDVTYRQFLKLSGEERQDMLDFFGKCAVCQRLAVNRRQYILGHAGVPKPEALKNPEKYHVTDFLFQRMDYGKRYFSDWNTFLVSGHTPTPLIRSDQQPLIYRGHGHIAIDCGCVFGGRLAAYCPDSGECVYVDAFS